MRIPWWKQQNKNNTKLKGIIYKSIGSQNIIIKSLFITHHKVLPT